MCDGTHAEIKMVDGVSEFEAGLELNTNSYKKRSQEEITDDDVFKELINIVMDVFSNKPEKCTLTFELPDESEVLKQISPKADVESWVDSYASKPNTLESKVSTKSSRKKKMKLMANNKYKLKKKLRRWHPVVQCALSGCLRRGKICGSLKPSSKNSIDRSDISYVGNKWTNTVQKFNTVPNTTEEITHLPSPVYALKNVQNEFKDVLNILEGLACQEPRRIPYVELSYHLKIIHNHVEAIRSSLQHSQSFESIDTTLHLSTDSSEFPIGKTKVGVRLVRIGAKIRSKSRVSKHLKKQRQHTHRTYERAKDEGLNDILKNYHRVKKEETEIVQVLLGKLGFQANHKCRRRQLGIPNRDFCDRKGKARARKDGGDERVDENNQDISKAANLQTLVKEVEKSIIRDVEQDGVNAENMNEPTDLEAPKNPQYNMSNISNPKQLKEIYLSQDERINKQRKPKVKTNRKHRGSEERSKNILKRYSPMLHEHPSLVLSNQSGGRIRNRRKGKVKNDITNPMGTSNKMMQQIQSAAKKLEHMHSLVERKLNRLCKQQKELNRKISTKTDTPGESHSNEDTQRERRSYKDKQGECQSEKYCQSENGNNKDRQSQNNENNCWGIRRYKSQEGACEPTRGSSLNLPTEMEHLIFQSYNAVDSRNSKEILRCRIIDRHSTNQMANGDGVEENLPKLESQQNLNEEFGGTHQSYVCNYMMELHGKKLDASEGSMEKQLCYGPGLEVFSSTVLTNEFQEDLRGWGRHPHASSPLSATIRESECEIMEESLFTKPLSSNYAQKHVAPKKKKRVVRTPLCTLS